jgi:hypothetical protein
MFAVLIRAPFAPINKAFPGIYCLARAPFN